jgi:hypothetical protein
MIIPEDASPETKRLIEMHNGHKGDVKFSVTEAIQKHPELVPGLDGYMAEVLKEGQQICEKTAKPDFGHSMRRSS